MDAWLGIAGVIVGSLLTVGVDWMNRRWDRKDKRRDILVARAEELAGFAGQPGSWQMKSFEAACQGDGLMPPWTLFRMQALTTIYLPEVEDVERALKAAVVKVQASSNAIATFIRRNKGVRPPDELIQASNAATTVLTNACGALLHVTSQRIRVELD